MSGIKKGMLAANIEVLVNAAICVSLMERIALQYLMQEGAEHQLNPPAMTALTPLIANSTPAEESRMIRLIVNLPVDDNELSRNS